jgi:hypothetical protein
MGGPLDIFIKENLVKPIEAQKTDNILEPSNVDN